MSNKNDWPVSWAEVRDALVGGGFGGSGGTGFINYTGGIEIDGNYIKFTDLTAENGLKTGDEIEIGLCYGYSNCDMIVGSYKLNFIVHDGVSNVIYPIYGYKAESINTNDSEFKLEAPTGDGCWTLFFGESGISIGEGTSDYQVMFVRIYKANA